MNKLFKYDLLRRLPGKIGDRYQVKHLRRHAQTRAFPEALRNSRNMTCIDLGANVGEYTRTMATVAKRVIAFEPDPWTLSVLQTNVADLDNVTIEGVAAGMRDGRTMLYRHSQFEENPTFYSESSSLIASKSNIAGGEAVEVRQVSFIDYLERLNEDIGIIKMDIEGAEVDLLETLFDRHDVMKRIHYIFAETHESRIPSHALRVKRLHDTVQELQRPIINLYWS